jgi:hypothetical protein
LHPDPGSFSRSKQSSGKVQGVASKSLSIPQGVGVFNGFETQAKRNGARAAIWRAQPGLLEDYLHDGYGAKPVGELLPMDVQQWLDKHPTWRKGTRRIAVQALKRALKYAVSMKVTPQNPIKGFKVGVGGKRNTYFTPEIEKELLQNAFQALRTAIQVCIRSGARHGCEFIALTAAHVEETPKGMLWRFSSDESKTHKPRTIYVAPEIAELVLSR